MFDAYQNGGNGLDGKPVTDQKMRAYIKGRRDSFSKDDPLYQEWGNRLIQLDFKIGEEKIGLAYKQGKVGAGAVAAFYREQLRHIPKDSEFYRDVAGRAADWAKAAGSAARGAARARLGKALEGKQKSIAQTWDRYSNLVNILTDAARRAGLISGNQQLTDADATDLQAFLAHGVAGPHGTTITFSDWQHATINAYKAFDDAIALNKQLNRGTKTLTKQKGEFLNENLLRVNTVDDRAKYELARDAFERAVNDAQGDPRAVLEAAQTYANALTQIKANAEKGTGLTDKNESDFIGGLTNEINALTTGKGSGLSVHDLYNGGDNQDLIDTAASIQKAQEDLKALQNGTAVYGQKEYGGSFSVIPLSPSGQLDPSGNGGLDKSYQKAVIDIDGVPTAVMLKGLPVQAKGLTDANGAAVTEVPINGQLVKVENLTNAEIADLLAQGYKTTDSKTIGYVFTQGGKTSYGVVQADGSIVYTQVNPFTGNLLGGKDGLGTFVGSTLGQDGKTVVPAPPNLNPVSASNVLTDESVTPKDLLALAATADEGTKALLIAEADKKTKAAQAESDYMKRAKEGDRTGGAPGGEGFLAGQLASVQATLKMMAETDTNSETFAAKPPSLAPSTYGPPIVPTAPPPASPGTPPAVKAPPPPKPPAQQTSPTAAGSAAASGNAAPKPPKQSDDDKPLPLPKPGKPPVAS